MVWSLQSVLAKVYITIPTHISQHDPLSQVGEGMVDCTRVWMMLLLQSLQESNIKCSILWFAKCLHGTGRHTAWARWGWGWRAWVCVSRVQHLWWQSTFYKNLHSSVQARASVESNYFTSQMIHEQLCWPALDMVTSMDDTSPHQGRAPVFLDCPPYIYKQSFQLVLWFQIMVWTASTLAYIHVVRNTIKNFFFCRALLFQFGLWQQSAIEGGGTTG